MNGSEDGGRAARSADPTLRWLGGCLVVVAGLAAIVIAVLLVVGWRLTRDETPGRPEEAFLLGDETRYWSFDLKPDDPGLVAVSDKIGAEAEAARDEALAHSPLRMLAFGRRRDQLGELLPLKLELAVAPGGWSGRATLTKGVLRVRAMVKILRWVLGRSSEESLSRDANGVEVTTLPDRHGSALSMAAVGNRLILANDAERVERMLAVERAPGEGRDPSIEEMHAAVRLPGEDGWAFAAGAAVASLDVDASDALVFRILAPAGTGAAATTMSPEDAIALARQFLPYVAVEAFTLDEGFPKRADDGRWMVAGRITELSRRVGAAFLRFSASRAEGAPEPQSPSASPPPPSPETSSDPRSGTPAAPKRAGTPNPVR